MSLLPMKTRGAVGLVCLCILLTVPSISRAALSIDADFDSGDIGEYTIDGNSIDFVLNADGLGYTYWTNFKVSGVLNQEVTFEITNADDVTFLSEAGRESQMVYSYDGQNWSRLTNHSYSSGTYTITQTFTLDEVQIATFFPFSYEKMDDYVDDVSSSQWATKIVLGQSKQGRDIDLITITNTGISIDDKKIIYIIGRQHAAEISSSHMLEGMVDFLISDNNSWAEGLRDNYVWYIVPMVNPDGVYQGNSRADSTGIDLNRDWGNTDSIEVNLVRDDIDLADSTDGIDMFIDWHSQMNDDRWYSFVYSPTGNTFYNILSAWTVFDHQNASGASGCTAGSCTSRGYIMNNILFDPTFIIEPTPHLDTWTEQSLNEQGRLTAFAINDYFGLFPPSPVLLDNEFEDSAGSDDLRLNSPQQDWYESRNDDQGLLTLDETDVAENDTKKAALKNYGISENAYLTQEFGEIQTGTFDISFYIYIDKIEDSGDYDRTAHIYIGDDSSGTNGPTSTSDERFVFLTFYDSSPSDTGNDLEIRAREPGQLYSNTSTWTQVASGLSYDTWYAIKTVVDVLAGTYDVYVDGILEGDDIAKYASPSLMYISFAADDAGRGNFYIDRVTSPAYDADSCSAANLDGSNPVNFIDFAILADNWKESGWDNTGDINKNRVVDLYDLDKLIGSWLDDCER